MKEDTGRKRVMRELLRMATADPGKILGEVRMGDGTVTIRGEAPDAMPRSMMAAVASVRVKTGAQGSEWEFRFHDKLKAIELYLKYEGGREGADVPDVTVEYDYGNQ